MPDSPLARRYEPLLVGRIEFVSFQTVAEVRYGALLPGWGSARLRRMEHELDRIEIVHSGPELVQVYAQLRVDCQRIGHAPARARRRPVDRCHGCPPRHSPSSRMTASSRTRPGWWWRPRPPTEPSRSSAGRGGEQLLDASVGQRLVASEGEDQSTTTVLTFPSDWFRGVILLTRMTSESALATLIGGSSSQLVRFATGTAAS